MATKYLLADGFDSDVVGKLTSPAINVLKAAIGHFLHTFLSGADVDRAKRLVANATVSEELFNKRDPNNHLLALQIVETYRLANQNAATDEYTSQRIQSYEKSRQALKDDLEKESKWYDDNIKTLHLQTPDTVYQTLVNTGIPLKRDADNHSQQLVGLKFDNLKRKFGRNLEMFRPPSAYVPQHRGDTGPVPSIRSLDTSLDDIVPGNDLANKVNPSGAPGRQSSGSKPNHGQQEMPQGNAKYSALDKLRHLSSSQRGQGLFN